MVGPALLLFPLLIIAVEGFDSKANILCEYNAPCLRTDRQDQHKPDPHKPTNNKENNTKSEQIQSLYTDKDGKENHNVRNKRSSPDLVKFLKTLFVKSTTREYDVDDASVTPTPITKQDPTRSHGVTNPTQEDSEIYENKEIMNLLFKLNETLQRIDDKLDDLSNMSSGSDQGFVLVKIPFELSDLFYRSKREADDGSVVDDTTLKVIVNNGFGSEREIGDTTAKTEIKNGIDSKRKIDDGSVIDDTTVKVVVKDIDSESKQSIVNATLKDISNISKRDIAMNKDEVSEEDAVVHGTTDVQNDENEVKVVGNRANRAGNPTEKLLKQEDVQSKQNDENEVKVIGNRANRAFNPTDKFLKQENAAILSNITDIKKVIESQDGGVTVKIHSALKDVQNELAALESIKDTSSENFRIGYIVASLETLERTLKKLINNIDGVPQRVFGKIELSKAVVRNVMEYLRMFSGLPAVNKIKNA